MVEVLCYSIIKYEVKLRNKPVRDFFSEEMALRFIEENKKDFVSMTKIEHAIIDLEV